MPERLDFPDGSFSMGLQVGKSYRAAAGLGDFPHDSPGTSLLRAPPGFHLPPPEPQKLQRPLRPSPSAPHSFQPPLWDKTWRAGNFFAGIQLGETQSIGEQCPFGTQPCTPIPQPEHPSSFSHRRDATPPSPHRSRFLPSLPRITGKGVGSPGVAGGARGQPPH